MFEWRIAFVLILENDVVFELLSSSGNTGHELLLSFSIFAFPVIFIIFALFFLLSMIMGMHWGTRRVVDISDC